jgi:hypothetical protein
MADRSAGGVLTVGLPQSKFVGRTDGFLQQVDLAGSPHALELKVFFPSIPHPEVGDEVLVAFEQGDVHRPANAPADPITFTHTIHVDSLAYEYWS